MGRFTPPTDGILFYINNLKELTWDELKCATEMMQQVPGVKSKILYVPNHISDTGKCLVIYRPEMTDDEMLAELEWYLAGRLTRTMSGVGDGSSARPT
jgi:hypothetical protein